MDRTIKTSTMVEEVVQRMRAMLYAGEFHAGERLRLRDLQEQFGVSHIPIREALRTLEAEGLVENLPQRGAVAAPVSLEVLSEVYDARRLLEPVLAARAAPKMTDEDIVDLSIAYGRLADVSGSGGDEFFEEHRRFHWLTMRAGATPTLERMLRQLWGLSERFLRLSLAFPSDVAPAIEQHRLIYELSMKRDPAVSNVVLSHLHLTENALVTHHSSAAAAASDDVQH